MSRRDFLRLLGASAVAAACSAGAARSAGPGPRRIKAVAFDLFTIFDPRGVDTRVAAVLPEAPADFSATWKASLFEYSWLRAGAGQFAPFDQLVLDSLDHAARAHRLELASKPRAHLAAVFTELDNWPDAPRALHALADRGLRLAPLANFTPAMIDALLRRSHLQDLFEAQISTAAARTYKPDPRAYALGESALGLHRSEIAFAAFGAWDASGARWFGYPSLWVNRLGGVEEALIAPDVTVPDLATLITWPELA